MDGLCRGCKHKFSRQFSTLIDNEDMILFTHVCLLSDIDVGDEFTIDCSGYEKIQIESGELLKWKSPIEKF